MADGASPMLGAADRLIGDLADAVPALRAVGDALASVATSLGVEKVIVAVDDAALGRQVFCSGRVPLGDEGIGLRGPPGAWTQPPRALDDDATRLLMLAIGVGVGRAGALEPRSGTAVVRATALEPRSGTAVVRATALVDAVTEAAARAARHGWGFTLVLVRGSDGLADDLQRHLRAADSLLPASDGELALCLPETAGDRVPYVLARLAAASGAPPFSFGLACCPADGTDPVVLCRTAAERLAEARRAADDDATLSSW
jgi:hypothetical protein